MKSINNACVLAVLLLFSTFAVQADERTSMQSGTPETRGAPMQLASHHNPCAHKKNPCNPCAMKGNPCNPCAMKGNPCNPCAMKGNPCNPCAMKGNPCNPCAGGGGLSADDVTRPDGTKPYTRRNTRRLVSQGEKLWNDTSLSTNGMSCNSCHVGGSSFNETYKDPYPHQVAMATNQAGIDGPITAEQMVQLCMKIPMAADTLPWDSKELAALRAYIEEENQPAYAKKVASNPCAMKSSGNPCNPCAMKGNPCNPCAMKGNPCAMKSNPCAKR